MGVTEVKSALVFYIPDFGLTHSQFYILHSIGDLLCSVLDNWQRGDTIGASRRGAPRRGALRLGAPRRGALRLGAPRGGGDCCSLHRYGTGNFIILLCHLSVMCFELLNYHFLTIKKILKFLTSYCRTYHRTQLQLGR